MEKISLEHVDQVIERTGVSYSKAKEALEYSNGDVLEAIIYLENKESDKAESFEKAGETIDEFKNWLKELIKRGNISRIKIKKDEKVIVDVPVNAGIAVAVIAVIMPALLAFGVIAAVATKITIEITKTDGTIEVVNKYITSAKDEVVDKASNLAETIKEKFNSSDIKMNIKKDKTEENKNSKDVENMYSYTVKFDENNEGNSKE